MLTRISAERNSGFVGLIPGMPRPAVAKQVGYIGNVLETTTLLMLAGRATELTTELYIYM